jgi:serine/threonine protein phosphatase PrpC
MKDPAPNPASATATTGRLVLSVVSSIHQGARDYQEDSLGHWFDAKHKRLFAVVADGAGGHGGGAEASQAAIEFSAKFWQQSSGGTFEDPEAFLTEWMKQAHLAVNEAAAKIHRSARSVVVACLVDGDSIHWVHAGDSRLLRFRDGKLAERTRDDSVVQVLFERGEITEEEMGTHPDQSRLLQSLGGPDAPSPRLGNAELVAGDVLILCSDGFWEHLKREELEQLTATPPAKRQLALDLAVKEAVRRAGPKADNTTAIMIHCDPPSGARQRGMLGCLVLILLAAIVAAATWWLGHSARSQTPPSEDSEIPREP